MRAEKQTYHHGDLPEHIALIAWNSVRENGCDKLSLRACARAAGVDPAAVYRHFKSKDELLGHLANRAFAELAHAMQTAKADADPKEALVQIGLAYIRYAVAQPHIFQMMFDLAGRVTGPAMSGASAEGDAAYDILVHAITRVASSPAREAHIFTLWSTVHGFAKLTNAGLGPEPAQLENVSRAVCESVVHTIR